MLATKHGMVEEEHNLSDLSKTKVVSAYEDEHYLFIITEKKNSLCKEVYVEE